MLETILIKNIYIGYPESLYSAGYIRDNEYLRQMAMDVNKLPPIKVIKLSDNDFSLSDGYHRISIFKHLNHKKIRCEVI